MRQTLFDDPWYRLVHGEGDMLPGLVIDRYDDILVVQITTAGMEQFRDEIAQLLVEMTHAKCVYFKNGGKMRALENLESEEFCAVGSLPDVVRVVENDLTYSISVASGQKTGWFFDHRYNRKQLGEVCAGARVLDVFSYTGGWCMNALAAGAAEVVAVDSSARAIEFLNINAGTNGYADKVSTVTADAVEALKTLHANDERFDVIVLDPPAFIKRKKDYKAGLQHYALLNRLAVRLLNPGGYLASASCSQALPASDLSMVARQAAGKTGHSLQVLHELGQAPDHPALAGMPESLYLKGLIGRLL